MLVNDLPVFILGRYLFLNAIANQLRYPNSHTHYFSCTLLYLFAEANSEAIQEQITRYDDHDLLFKFQLMLFSLIVTGFIDFVSGSCWSA